MKSLLPLHRLPAPARQLTLVWLSLLSLTALSFWLAEQRMAAATPLVLAIATVKVLLIGAVFMELRHAPKAILLGFLLFFCLLGLGLSLIFAL